MTNRALPPLVSVALLFLTGCINLGPLVAGRIEEVVVYRSPRLFERNRVALIDVEGFISAGRPSWYRPDGTCVADVREKLERAARDRRVRAVVLRINSPGGEVGASDMIHREISEFRRQTGKPVVAMLMSVAASGGYYVACAADRIIIAPSCVTGSVGVIMQFLNVQGLFGKIGLHAEAVKSGEMKDIASPLRPMTTEERQVLQDINRKMFERFLDAVRRGRPQSTDEDAATYADGRILSAEQAVALHLADRAGYVDDAVSTACELAGIPAADVILYRPFPSYNSNVYASQEAGAGLVEQGLRLLLQRQGAAFLYLWSPGL